MLHWPDTMFTYMDGENILFSNDGFGQHFATESLYDDRVDMAEMLYEAKKYYANILAPFSMMVTRKLNEILARKHYANLTVYVHPRNIERLRNEDRKLISAIEKENKTSISLQADPMFHVEEFQITDTVTGTNLGKS